MRIALAVLRVEDERWVLADKDGVSDIKFHQTFGLKWWVNRDYAVILHEAQERALLVDFTDLKVYPGIAEGDILMGYIFSFRKDGGE